MDLDSDTKTAFAKVQQVLDAHKLTIETEGRLLVVMGPDMDMKRGRGRTLAGAVKDFLRANSG